MSNASVAEALEDISQLLELRGDTGFRVRAYDNAAKVVASYPEDLRQVAQRGELDSIPGIGKAIAEKISDLLATGSTAYLEDLRREFPEGVLGILRVPGIGPSLARRAYRELGIENVDELRAAAEDGRLASLKGMGPKSAENVLRGLQRVSKEEYRILINTAVPLVEHLVQQLLPQPAFSNLTAAGSLRRWRPTIGDIDLIATSDSPAEAMAAFVALPDVRDLLGHGPTKSAVVTVDGMQVDLRIVPADQYGSLLQHFTGSRDHNILLRDYALRRGLSLNEYGITNVKTGDVESFADEVAFYRALGLEWIPPELREGHGEIDAARRGALPDLVDVRHIRGELHMHSDWSDGSVPIETMVVAARERGYEYVAVTDHSGGIGVAGGLSPDRLLEQIDQIEQLRNQIKGIHILCGSEVDIKRDGSLDFPDEILARLDWVIASVHSGFNQSEEQMTERIIRAIENPYVDAIAHPTGRLINKREPYAVDLEAVFRAAAGNGTALEINSQPSRLDLSDVQAHRAIELGVKLVIDTDAHAPAQLDNIRYGVAMARRGWAQAANVINTQPLDALRANLKNGGQRRG